MIDKDMMKTSLLSEIKPGKNCLFSSIDGEIFDIIHMAEQGFVKNSHVQILQNDFKGPLIVKLKGSKLMIGRKLSKKIHVVED